MPLDCKVAPRPFQVAAQLLATADLSKPPPAAVPASTVIGRDTCPDTATLLTTSARRRNPGIAVSPPSIGVLTTRCLTPVLTVADENMPPTPTTRKVGLPDTSH